MFSTKQRYLKLGSRYLHGRTTPGRDPASARRWRLLSTSKARLLPALLTHEFHDIGRRPARYEARDVIEVNPATPGYFITRASFGAIRDFAREHVMVLLLATEVEEMLG